MSINKKLDNIRGRIDKIYEDMLKHEGFATAQKVKLSFLGIGVMDDAILKVFNDQNEYFKKLVEKEERSESTYNKYITVYNHLTTFLKERYHRDDMAFRSTCRSTCVDTVGESKFMVEEKILQVNLKRLLVNYSLQAVFSLLNLFLKTKQ